jgi:hypothetical protein
MKVQLWDKDVCFIKFKFYERLNFTLRNETLYLVTYFLNALSLYALASSTSSSNHSFGYHFYFGQIIRRVSLRMIGVCTCRGQWLVKHRLEFFVWALYPWSFLSHGLFYRLSVWCLWPNEWERISEESSNYFLVLVFLHCVRSEFTDDVSETAVGLIYIRQHPTNLLICILAHDYRRCKPQRLPEPHQ